MSSLEKVVVLPSERYTSMMQELDNYRQNTKNNKLSYTTISKRMVIRANKNCNFIEVIFLLVLSLVQGH